MTATIQSITARAHRLLPKEWVTWNKDIKHSEVYGQYDDNGMNHPRIIAEPVRIKSMRKDGYGSTIVRIDSDYQYLAHHLTYPQFRHCCGAVVAKEIPDSKRRFLKALWLIIGGYKPIVNIGMEVPSISHHEVVFTQDFENVRINMGVFRGGLTPTNREGLATIRVAFTKHRLAYRMPTTEEEVLAAKASEKTLLAPKVANVKSRLSTTKANLTYHRQDVEEYVKYIGENECAVSALKAGIGALSDKGIAFEGLLPILSSQRDNMMASIRELKTRHRRLEATIKEEAMLCSSLANIGTATFMPALFALYNNKIIKGFAFDNQYMVSVLFAGFKMKIGPVKKCVHKNTKCRCQIVIPGTITIAPFIIHIKLYDNALQFGIRKHMVDVYHPHFRTDGNHCLGGYEEGVHKTLQLFDVSSFLMVMADYIHSFDIHSMLTDDKRFDFMPSGSKEYPDRDGIFTQDYDSYENNNDESCDGCDDGCDECNG